MAASPATSVDDERPLRPRLPPLLAAGLGLWGAAALVYPLLRTASSALCGGLAAAAALAFGAAAVALLVRRPRLVTLAVTGALCGLLLAALGALALHQQADAFVGQATTWQVTLAEDAQPSLYGSQATARAVAEDGTRLKVRVYLSCDGGGLLQGSRFSVRAPLKALSAKAATFGWEKGLAGTLDAAQVPTSEVQEPGLVPLRRRAIDLLGQQGSAEGALLQALVCGYRVPLNEQGLAGPFQQTGLAHLVAVSGAHLTLVVLFVTQLLQALRLGRRATSLAVALFIGAYLGLTGLPVSALRAAAMTLSGLFAFMGQRRGSALNALGLCLIGFIAQDVSCAVEPSFVLSAGSTLGILLFAPLLSSLASFRSRRLQGLVGEPLALTLASSLATQPYSAALFAQVPLIAPLANVAAAPLFTLACVAGFAATALGLLVPGIAPAAVPLAAASAKPLLAVAHLLANIPFGCIAVCAGKGAMVALSVGLSAGLWLWWPRRKTLVRAALSATMAAALACGAAVAVTASQDQIVMLDVGQGDAFLIRSQGHALLVDTGNQDRLLKESCGRQGVFALDAVAVSHHDDDHCGSLSALASVAEAPTLLVAAPTLNCPCASCTQLIDQAKERAGFKRVQGLSVGDQLVCGRFTLTVVWPESFTDEGGNGDSLSFLCAYDANGDGAAEWTALFCGDAEADQLQAMAPRLPAQGVDVLKVGHHGSRVSLNEPLAQRLSPQAALISAGEGNRYGHPTPECLAVLEEAGCRVLRTDEQGDVTLRFTAREIAVVPQHGSGVNRVQ